MPDERKTLDNIEPIEIEEEMEGSYLDYAMSVITAGALPDARDGLKPVQRRILYGMYAEGMRRDRPDRKCGNAVGEVMGKYHPHGDQSIYDALARMAQDFSLRYPLIDGHGNFGSPNDRPAAARYTEARLSPLAMDLLGEIDEDTVDFGDTYDGRNREPLVVPARFPNLLVNGGGGIAVGMATNIPPHNLGEVIDLSAGDTVGLVIDLKRDANAQVVLNQLFKHTPMQTNFAANVVALVDGVPRLLNLRMALEVYVAHQIDVVTRRSRYRLNKARDRAHILEG